MKGKDLGWKIFTIACAALVPILFALNAMQADRYMKAQDEIKQLEQKQVELVEENKRLITELAFKRRARRKDCGRRAWNAKSRVRRNSSRRDAALAKKWVGKKKCLIKNR